MAENSFNGNQYNPKDPLNKAGPNSQLELFKRFSAVSNGFPADFVISAAANMIINALRQCYADRKMVETRFDELFGKSKTLLLDHYDSVSGKRKNIFPHTQVIAPQPFHVDKDKH